MNTSKRTDGITFEVPNLDGASIDPADYEALAKVFDNLSTYCAVKANAMKSRLSGDIAEASVAENWLERICRRLPGWARW